MGRLNTRKIGPQCRLLCRFSAAAMTVSPRTQRAAAEKRQGTKSREVGHWPSSERYEDLMRAPSAMIDGTLTGFDFFVCRYGRSAGCRRPFGRCLERIDARSAH